MNSEALFRRVFPGPVTIATYNKGEWRSCHTIIFRVKFAELLLVRLVRYFYCETSGPSPLPEKDFRSLNRGDPARMLSN